MYPFGHLLWVTETNNGALGARDMDGRLQVMLPLQFILPSSSKLLLPHKLQGLNWVLRIAMLQD